MKEIKVPLSKQGLNDLLKKINNLKSNLEQIDENIQSSLADYAEEQISQNLAATQFKDGNDDVSVFKETRGNVTVVGMRGTQVLYDEFGTGTQGEQSPHPIKGQFGLNGYNTGKKIRKASTKVNENHGIPLGKLYWTYKDTKGNTVFTTGIPAGKQVFNAAMSLRNKKMQIVKKEVSDALSKL